MPVGQPIHQLAAVAPISVLNVPTLQFTNVVLAKGQYCPVGHTTQLAADVWLTSVLNVPALQFVNVVDPTGQ